MGGPVLSLGVIARPTLADAHSQLPVQPLPSLWCLETATQAKLLPGLALPSASKSQEEETEGQEAPVGRRSNPCQKPLGRNVALCF